MYKYVSVSIYSSEATSSTKAMNRIQTSMAVLGLIGILSGQPAAISAQTTQLRITQLSEKDYLQQGISKYDRGDFEGAIADFTQAVRPNPQSAVASESRGNAGTITAICKARSQITTIAINPNSPSTYYNLVLPTKNLKIARLRWQIILKLSTLTPTTPKLEQIKELQQEIL